MSEASVQEKMIASIIEDISKNPYGEAALKAIREESFRDGAQAALSWLEEVYGEGIQETDAWGYYMDEEETEEEEL